MKLNQLVAIFPILIACACKKDNNPGGTVSLKINGESWAGPVRALAHDSMFSFNIDRNAATNGNPYSDETFGILLSRKTLQRQYLKAADPTQTLNTNQAVFSTRDFDVSCEYFTIIATDTANNYLQITGQQDNFSEVEGEFECLLVKQSSCSYGRYPDTLRITDGSFHLVLE